MTSFRRLAGYAAIGAALPALATKSASADSHQWRFSEIFSNADGTIQFIEMQECCGDVAEVLLQGKWIRAVNADNQFTFSTDLSGDTAHRYLLLATQGFADLPDAPVPDFIIPENFLPLDGDTLQYFLYFPATWTYFPGNLPVDGVNSLSRVGTTEPNSPTNFAGQSGSIDLRPAPIPALSGLGLLVMLCFVLMAAAIVLKRVRRPWAPGAT